MNDATALLQSILSDPADDHCRLLYADHLEECGEGERAEFIRVQVELGRKLGGDRCYACQWPIDDTGIGCRRDGDCSYRPSKHNLDYDRWLSLMHEISEFRCRERDILLYQPWPQWFALPKNREGYFLNGFGFEAQNQQGIGITPQRGFISTVRLSWQDWLRHNESLYWHPKQTVECPNSCWCLDGSRYVIPNPKKRKGGSAIVLCPKCSGTGRIPRPFVDTAQPITRVELTTWPCEPMTGINASAIGAREHTFNRVKCSACDGEPYYVPEPRERRVTDWITTRPIELMMVREECPKCHGQPLNEWHCDQWPTITFAMPT